MTEKTKTEPSLEQPQKPAGVNDSDSPKCRKCVKVLRELIAGLKEEPVGSRNDAKGSGMFSETPSSSSTVESAPLTLLKAIAGMNTREKLNIEMVDDGVKLHVPVETTPPEKLLSWTRWLPPQETLDGEKQKVPSVFDDFRLPLALSVKENAIEKSKLVDPLTIELKCRKCASTGPEAGARAFLMGPQPLSIIVCHNRVHSEKAEIEEILSHELIHLYDVQTLRLDLQQCENLAYSEVRAAKAAECRDSWHPHLQTYCVRQKAICATNNLFPVEGRSCIQRVFEHAFADNRPFHSQTTEAKMSQNQKPTSPSNM